MNELTYMCVLKMTTLIRFIAHYAYIYCKLIIMNNSMSELIDIYTHECLYIYI